MQKKVITAVLAACSLGVAACSDTTGGGTGRLTVRLTDAPFPYSDVSRVDVFVVRVDAKLAEPTEAEAEDEDNTDGWITLGTPNALINLLDYVGGTTTTIAEASIPTGTYRGFRLVIDPAQSSVTLKDGGTPDVKWPSAARSGIKVNLEAPVAVDANGSVLLLDFDVGRSFVLRGNDIRNNGLLVKPVVRGTAIDVTGSANGAVRGDSATGVLVADATVEVLKDGTDLTDAVPANVVATTKTDANGAFRFGFLLPGSYELRVTPPTGSAYKPALLASGFNVSTGEETTGLLVVLPK